MPPHSPPFPNASHEQRSAPPTPNNTRSGTSPPEAAIEATPETTPVKVYIKLIIYRAYKRDYTFARISSSFCIDDTKKVSN